MTTRETIIQLADQLIRNKGYNAFSFYDIAKTLDIKTASIHYYFPCKTQLGLAVVQEHEQRFARLQQTTAAFKPVEKLQAFVNSYVCTRQEGCICIVGSLASDLHTLDEAMRQQLAIFANGVLAWVEGVLAEGLATGQFAFDAAPRTKALMLITNLLAALQLTRLTGAEDFTLIAETITQELCPGGNKGKHT